ncbi:hypothetical protein ACOMHN_017765 [Nucella lapillus]
MATVACQLQEVICGICKEIYVSPRFLKGCYHSFCMQCINDNSLALGSRTIACPICRQPTTLPKNGAAGLPLNFYYKEETLAEACKLLHKSCEMHKDTEVDRVCLSCDVSACEKCSEHGEGHSVQILSESETDFDGYMYRLHDQVDLMKRELKNLQEKTSAQSLQLQQQRDLLHAKVDQVFNINNNNVWVICRRGSEKLVKKISFLQQEIEKSMSLFNQGKKCWEKRSGKIEAIDVAKQVKRRLEEEPDLLSPVRTGPIPHPGLVSSMHNDVDQTLSGFLGQPIEHNPPQQSKPPPDCVKDVKIPLQNRRLKEIREVLGVAPSDDGSQVMFTFRGKPSHLSSSVAVVRVEDGAVISADHSVFQGKSVGMFERLGRSERSPVVFPVDHDFGVLQISKARACVCLNRDTQGNIQLHNLALTPTLGEQAVRSQVPISRPKAGSFVMSVDVVEPFNMDITEDGRYCVIIDKVEDTFKTSSRPRKKRKLEKDLSEYAKIEEGSPTDRNQRCIKQPMLGAVVKLFYKGQSQPIDVYCPAKYTFVPSDVCFCRWKKRQLLIADWQNDEIHVVHVAKSGFHFQRLLGERHGALVKPRALNTDSKGKVYIGCSNGSLLCWCMKYIASDEQC